MNKKSEWTIGLAVAALLGGYFIYQVAYGMTTEGSYQQGYKWGRNGYQCSNFDADCDNGLNSCDVGNKIYVNVPHNYARVVDSISNRTACLDGMVNGWKYWCNTDLELCAKFVLSNVFPGVFADNETDVNICLKDAGDNVNNDDPNNILREWLENDSTLFTIPQAGHFVQHQAAELVTRSIVKWLDR